MWKNNTKEQIYSTVALHTKMFIDNWHLKLWLILLHTGYTWNNETKQKKNSDT